MLESTLTHLVCTGCQRTVSADEWHGTCPDCGHVLAARYDLERARRTFRPAELAARPWTLWRYAELLPVCDPRFRLTLGEGGTPLLPAPRLARTLGSVSYTHL
ncbi:MAG: threonine synthase, partial [Thermomicrobium sp.]|nr:threonine synthase [Thermomicrobium sp.]